MRNLKTISIAIAGALFLASCSPDSLPSKAEDKTEGNANAESVGAITFQSIGEAQATEDLLAMGNPAPANLLEQSALPSLAMNSGVTLAKKSAAASFAIDTLNKKVIFTNATGGFLNTRYDTLEILFDETVFDDIDGNESAIGLHGATVHTNGTIEYYLVEDRDGDGVINGKNPPQRLALKLRSVYTKDIIGFRSGEETEVMFEADGGADNDFDTETDNRLYRASWVKTNGDDTLAYAFYEDADGDGVIAATGEGTVDVRFFEKRNPLKPLVEYGKASLRIERNDEGDERTARFTAEEKLITGRLNRVWVVDATGDSTISIGGIALVHFATNSPAIADSEITAQAVFTVDPGADLGDVSDNRLREMLLAKSFRFGTLDSMEFHCAFDPAVPHGEKPAAGTFELTAMYRNGQTATLVGAFSGGEIEAIYTGPEGNVTEVTLREGERKL